MHFRLLLLVSVVATMLSVAHAAPQTSSVTPIAIPPVALRASMPRGSKTWFYGKAPKELSKRSIYLHFYSIPAHRPIPKPNLAPNGSYLVNPRDYVLSIWEQRGTTRRARFNRVNSVQFSGAESLKTVLIERYAQYIKTKSDVLWLRDSTRQTPIIRLNVQLENGVNASTVSSDLLFVFTSGLNSRPHVQQFTNYSEFERSASHRYDQADAQGNLTINEEVKAQEVMDGPLTTTKTKFHWNGHEFEAEGTTTSVSHP